jgi:hypothetical protein
LPQGVDTPRSPQRVKITDFGLARMADDVHLTQAGVVAGTPEYMAPEQARGEPVDHRADLFSLGSVLYACCTGRPPFQGSTALAVLRQVSEDDPAPVRSLNPDVPAWLEAVIARLMAKDPGQRFQTAAEVAHLLDGYLAHLRQPATVPAPDLPTRPAGEHPEGARSGWRHRLGRWFRSPVALAAVLVLAALGLSGAAWLAGGTGATTPRQGAYQEYYQSFKGYPEDTQGLELIGPNAEQHVRYEADGLRITLPADHGGERPSTGLSIALAVKGDFEITVTFEILREPDQADTGEFGTRFSLGIFLNTPSPNVATLSRSVGAKAGSVFVTWYSLSKDNSVQKETRSHYFPTTAKTGRLRLVRDGAVLSYYIAEGTDGEFVLRKQYPFSEEELKEIRLAGSTGGPAATLDVRVTDLRVRAESIQGRPAEAPSPLVPQRADQKTWLAVAGVIGLVLALSLAGVWLYARRTRRGRVPAAAPAPAGRSGSPSLSCRCPGCGKNLRVRPGFSGKKVRCPQCGQPVPVPAGGANIAPRTGSGSEKG